MTATLIRNHFQFVIEAAPDLTERFYVLLFERSPHLRALFGRRSEKAQADMLAGALIAVIDHLEDPVWLATTLAPLGDKHRTYGVTDEMYGLVASALIATLASVSGPSWNPELEKAWHGALTFVATTMIKGADVLPLPAKETGETGASTPLAR